MGKKRPHIYQRILLFEFISILTIMIIYGFVSFTWEVRDVNRSMSSDTSRIAERLASNLASPLWNLQREAVEAQLIQEVRDPYLSGIAVFQGGGLWVGRMKTAGNTISPLLDESAMSGSARMPEVKIVYKDTRGGEWDIGRVVLYTTDTAVRDVLFSRMVQTIIQALALVVLLGAVTIVVLNVHLNKPLKQITGTARRIANGEIDLQAEVSGPQEVAALAATFNTMTSRLRDSLLELDRYFINALDMLCIAGRDGRIRRMNREWEAALGYSPEECGGRSLLEFVHPDDMERTREMMAQLSEPHQEVRDFVNRCLHKTGDARWIEWRSFPHGDLIYFTARDITKRKMAEEEISVLNEFLENRVAERTARLEAMNKELETFAYSIAHDLRAPLRAINGYTRIIAEDYGRGFDEKGKRIVSVVVKETRRMDQLIASLLTLLRVGRSAMKPALLDMAVMARAAFQGIAEPDADVELVVGDLPPATGDASLVNQVWTNLLSNAVKFTSKTAGARISVEGAVKGDELIYSVHDNGAGFDMRYSKKLFGIFQRLHTPDEFEGNGIGLALVHRIVTMHGGRVWAEGDVGKGAAFSFSLPRESPLGRA